MNIITLATMAIAEDSQSSESIPAQIIKQVFPDWGSPYGITTIFLIIAICILALFSCGILVHLIKNGRIKRASNKEFSNAAKAILSKEIGEFLRNEIKKIVEEQIALTKETADEIDAIMRVTLLAQENTPEARLEIIKELQKHKRVDGELADKIQRIVNDSIKKRDEEAKERERSIANAKKAVQDLSPMVDNSKKEEKIEEEEEDFGSL